MSRFCRVAWIGVPSLILAGVLGLGIEHMRGRRQLDATVSELKLLGRLPVAEILFAPPGPSNGVREMIHAAGQLSSVAGPDMMKVIAPGQAVESFRQAGWRDSGGRSNAWETLAAWHRDHAQDFDELHRALAQPECRMAVDWRRGANVPLPSLLSYKVAARALSAGALVSARDGDKEAALRDLADLRRLERALEKDALHSSQLVRIASADIAVSAVWDIAQRPDWTEAELGALQAALPSTNFTRGIAESIRGDTSLWEITLRNWGASVLRADLNGAFPLRPLAMPSSLAQAPAFALEVIGRTGWALRVRVVDPFWRYAWRDQAVAFHLRTMDDFVRRCSRAGESADLQSLSLKDLPGTRSMGWYDRIRFQLTADFISSFHPSLLKALRTETRRALVETGIALRRYSLRHDRIPGALSDLVPGFLPSVPLDGMVGKPLRYRANPDGSPSLWSVGEDFHDDGGDPTPKDPTSTYLRWWDGKDAVLPRRASDTEFAAWQAKEAENGKREAGKLNLDPALARRYGLIPAPAPATNAPAPR